jgi:Bifunctional DNA primase/polymerase, N-terminal
MPIDHNLEAALRLIGAGFHVHPCNPNPRPHPQSKHPLTAWKSAATNLERGVRYFANRYRGAVYGIHLGHADAVVLDLDRHSGGHDGVAEFEAMLEHFGGTVNGVPIVATLTGGYHLWFAQPPGREPLGNGVGCLEGLGIDVRGHGGYVIGPGCVMSDGTFYECASDQPDLCETFAAKALPRIFPWLVDCIEWKDESVPSSPAPVFTDGDAGRLRKWALGALRNKASALAMVREGNRNNALNSGVFALAGIAWCGITEREVYDAMLWACTVNKLIADDGIDAFNATFRSAWNAGILKPLPGPRERYPDSDIIIDLKPKMGRAA